MATTATWSTLYLGNLADMDSNETTFEIENPSPLLTTFGGGPGNALARHIVDVESTGYVGDGVVESDNLATSDYLTYVLDDVTYVSQLDSQMGVNGTVTFYDGSTYSGNFTVFQDSLGNVFLTIDDGQTELASAGIDSITFTEVTDSDYFGLWQYDRDDLAFVCLSPGARVTTPGGSVRADHLRIGDPVVTLDHGPQPVRWIGKDRLRFHQRPHPGQPVLIGAGAFGPELPRRDLILSPNHRVLIRTAPSYALHDPRGALAPAKALTRLPGVRLLGGRREITYFALLFDRHEVIEAEGIAVESLFPGPGAFTALSGPDRSAWLRLAARNGRLTGQPPARLMLGTAETRQALSSGLATPPGAQARPRRHAQASSSASQ